MKKQIITYYREHFITISISTILILIIINSTVSYFQVNAAEKKNALHKEIAEVKSRLNKVNTHVNLADMSFRGFMIVEKEAFLEPFNDQVMKSYQLNYDSLQILLENQGFDVNVIPPVKEKVGNYMKLINSMIVMRRAQKMDEIIEILETDPGYEVWKVYSAFVKKALAFEEDLEAKSIKDYERISIISTIIQFLLLPILILTIIKIRRNNIAKKLLFNSIEQNTRKYIFDPNEENGIKDDKVIIKNLIHNLKKISQFIKEITNGNYAINWEELNNQNKDVNKENIVGDLINMREQMKLVKEQDEKRLWATEGISKFSEIIRIHQNDVNELCFEVISNLVKYVKAHQGGIFILEDTDPEDVHLKLVACYAFSRKKFLEKRIEIGDGLIGQAYLEEDSIYMTKIPEDYLTIRSGLGDANPSSVLIIPFKYNDKVEAVLEIASFSKLNQHEIEFVQKVGEYVASAISSVKVTVKTRKLLENSQEQAEQMRSQEEEMRQNMEELQATQEEVQRRTLEYQQVIEANNEELENLRKKVLELENQNN